MKTTTLYLTVKIDVEHPQGADIDHIINELGYDFKSGEEGCKVTDSEIVSHEVHGSVGEDEDDEE